MVQKWLQGDEAGQCLSATILPCEGERQPPTPRGSSTMPRMRRCANTTVVQRQHVAQHLCGPACMRVYTSKSSSGPLLDGPSREAYVLFDLGIWSCQTYSMLANGI